MQDDVESVKWRREAAEQGYSIAQFGVGSAYEDGKGVARNYTEAAKWYSRAAEQGDIGAQVALGSFYELGNGVPKNNVEAYKWFNLASAHSATDEIERKYIESSARLRDGLVKVEEMTSEEDAEAQRRSAAFVPRKEVHGSNSTSSSRIAVDSPFATGTGFFITDDGYLISNYHVVKDAAKVRLLTGVGLIDAKVVKVDAGNDLALLKAEGRFAPMPVAASRGVKLGGTVATVGRPPFVRGAVSQRLLAGFAH